MLDGESVNEAIPKRLDGARSCKLKESSMEWIDALLNLALMEFVVVTSLFVVGAAFVFPWIRGKAREARGE